MTSNASAEPARKEPDPGRSGLLAWCAGAAAGLMMVVVLYGGSQTNFDDATLAKGTTTIRASVGGHRIHCEDDRDAMLCIAGARARALAHTVLWLGNSQLHAINQYRQGEQNAAPLLHASLAGKGLDLVAFSEPNANLQEHAVVFASLLNSLPIETLVLPVVFDDMREDGVRSDLLGMLHSADVTRMLTPYPVGAQMLAANKAKAAEIDTGAIRQTLQEIAERQLTHWMDLHSTFWHARAEAQGRLFVGLYELRNAVFQIKPQTARRVIPSRYRINRDALRMTLDLARQHQVHVVLYIAPIRNDVPVPYFADQYLSFKSDMKGLADEYGAELLNLESLVPPQYWGVKDATSLGGEPEIDYMHFQAPGHGLLADRIGAAVIAAHARKGAAK